jgi:hypothetical protein
MKGISEMAIEVNQAELDWYIKKFKDRATEKMNPEAKKVLVDALRSGKYAQTTGYLQVVEKYGETEPGFCCLGVLTVEAMNHGVEGIKTSRPEAHGGKVVRFESEDDSSSAFLIGPVAKWAQIPGGVINALMGINDNGGSFELIADLIEEYL